MPLSDLGINPDSDLTDQFAFTRTVASDVNGVQRASTWQACPGVLVYRRDIAKEVFGTDDPVEIGKKTADWATMKTTAEELKAKGYYAFSCYVDSLSGIKMAPLSSYDQGCVELIQNAFGDYLQGQIDYDTAKTNFETAIRIPFGTAFTSITARESKRSVQTLSGWKITRA